MQVDQAQRVRAQQAHAGAPRGGHQLGLHGNAGAAHFGEASAEQDGRGHAALTQRRHHFQHLPGRHGDNGHVRHFGQRGDRRPGLQSLHLAAVGIDRQDAPGIAKAAHGGDRPAADARGVVRGADDGDRTRIQQFFQGCSRVHGSGLHWVDGGPSAARLQASVKVGSGAPPSDGEKRSCTFWPMRTASRSQSTICVIMVTPSSSVT
ncbi:hypothetical protein D3C72_1398150 [compost metagenome]